MKYMFTLFHKKHGFFGRTYRSGFMPLRKAGDTYDTNASQYIYFYSAIPSNDFQIVIEFVVRPKDLFSGQKLDAASAGWVALEITPTAKKGMYADVMEGTPRLLLLLSSQKLNANTHKRGARIEYETMPLGGDRSLRRLVPENCVCGPNDQLPGLEVNQLPCNLHALLQSPADSAELKLLPTEEIYINSCIIKAPLRLSAILVETFRPLCEGEVAVYEYRLRAACHNQWQCVNKSRLRNSIILTQDGGYLKSNGILGLDGVFTSPAVAVLFQLECTLEVSLENSQKEIVSLLLGELVALPNIDTNSLQFLPSIVNEPFAQESIMPETTIWTVNSGPNSQNGLTLICEVSPYQGSAEENNILTLVQAAEERSKVEAAHTQWLKEHNERETLRNRELQKQERELELKAKKLSTYIAHNKAKKPIPTDTQMSKTSPRFSTTELPKLKEEVAEDEGMGREIPRGDQVLIEDFAAGKIEDIKAMSATLSRIDENIKHALKASTIIMEFDSVKKGGELPKKLAFSMQFYTSPLIRTESAIVDESIGEMCPLKLGGAVKNWTNFLSSQGDSVRVQFDIEPYGDDIDKSFKEFIEYLKENACKIWIWNPETLILIGVCKIPLIDLIRVEESMKVVKKKCEIFAPTDRNNEIIGQLYVTLHNIGRKDSGGTQLKADAIMKESPLKKRGKVKVKSKPITAQELSRIPKTTDKASLAYAYKEYTMHTHRAKPWEQEGLFPDYEKYRMYSRSIVLAGMVDFRTQKGFEYSLGEVKVYPVQFSNKHHRETTFNVLISDSDRKDEVTLIEDPKEWKQYCMKMRFEEPPDWGMASNSKFLLKPYEKVTLLFKVLALSPPVSQNRLINITIYNSSTNGVELSDELILLHHPCYYNALYLLDVPEARSIDTSFLLDSCLEKFLNSKMVLCNDSNAEVTIDGNRLNLTMTVDSSMKDTELYITTYADQYCLEHLCNILVTLRPHTCIDVNETAGKRIVQFVPLNSLLGRSQKQYLFYSSDPDLVRLDYGYSNPVTVNESFPSISLSICTYKIGRSHVLLHAIGFLSFDGSRLS
eukprot:TRINITY_DN3763_c0_g1_i3.p1 TRINITY_DN3763_c0_g1~~TRINITY_DN3763_c0_g1_i3.p1  ORF type:complete len:1055 (-),score=254.86 TRINITY_DN3763_c0_g1_i3:159-3323(-)